MKFEFAKHYDQFAIAQKQVAQDLANALSMTCRELDGAQGCNFNEVFEIGCGSGIFTNHLEQEFNCNKLVVNDLYEAKPMARLPHIIGDINEISFPQNQNLVATSSVLQWIADLDSLLRRINSSLSLGGLFAAGTFTAGTLYELESFTHQGLPYLTDEDFRNKVASQFKVHSFSSKSCSIPYESLRDLLKSLKETGVNNVEGGFRLTRDTLKGLEGHFNKNYKLTYNYSVIVAQKI